MRPRLEVDAPDSGTHEDESTQPRHNIKGQSQRFKANAACICDYACVVRGCPGESAQRRRGCPLVSCRWQQHWSISDYRAVRSAEPAIDVEAATGGQSKSTTEIESQQKDENETSVELKKAGSTGPSDATVLRKAATAHQARLSQRAKEELAAREKARDAALEERAKRDKTCFKTAPV